MKTKLAGMLIFLSTSLLCPVLFAQVTIGSGFTPEKAALLDIKEIANKNGGETAHTGGLLLPRVNLEKRTELYPFIRESNYPSNNPDNDPIYKAEKPAHTGLIVYNLSEVLSEDFEQGFYLWNGTEWRKLIESTSKAIFTIECSDIIPRGTYIKGKPLTSSNFLEIKVNISKSGSYNITGSTAYGYFFSTSGTFYNTGEFYALGQGIPNTEGLHEVTMYGNEKKIECDLPPTINVLSDIGTYTLDCTSIQVKGLYEAGKTLNTDSSRPNVVVVNVNVSEIGSYEIKTEIVDGIQFSGSGNFTSTGIQTVTLTGAGIPSTIEPKEFTLVSNSKGGTSLSCPFTVQISIPAKRILSLGSNSWALHGSGGTSNIFNSPHNFGTLDESTFKAHTPTILPADQSTFISGNITFNKIKGYIEPGDGSKPVDIIFMAFDSDIQSDLVEPMYNYVQKGGVLIMLNEHNKEDIGNFNLVKKLMGDDPDIAGTDNRTSGGGYVFKLPNHNDIILNGPFGDIRDKYVGEDSGYADTFTLLPMTNIDWFIPFYNYSAVSGEKQGIEGGNEIFAFKSKNLNFFWCGDGGLGSSGAPSSKLEKPVDLSSSPDYKPLSKLYGRNSSYPYYVDNATFIANLLAWALYRAEVYGINSK
ncbi:MAG: hypothetical protein E6767_19525 [Dysgonomonas sp.]|nr:hypothetical protein [Dysgonomonas sp.]